MTYITFVLLVLMCLGHVTIWAAIWNRLHGIGLSYGVCSRMTALLVALGATIPTVLVMLIVRRDLPLFDWPVVNEYSTARIPGAVIPVLADGYVLACWLALPYSVLWRVWRRTRPHPPVHHFTTRDLAFEIPKPFGYSNIVGKTFFQWRDWTQGQLLRSWSGFPGGWRRRPGHNAGHRFSSETKLETSVQRLESSNKRRRPNSAQRLFADLREERYRQVQIARDRTRERTRNGARRHFLLHLPGNESLMCEQVDVGIRVARLPKHLEGMTIVQLSDLHFTGKIGLDYYNQAVEHTNGLRPDLIFVTGDIVDRPDCIGDAAAVLSRLRAQHGVFFVLGNHDLRADAFAVRKALSDAGLIDVGGRVVRISSDGISFLIGGNELPWFGPPPDFSKAVNGDRCAPLRLLLAHTPDQFSWAIRNEVDLMLAGHTHGGQICLPGLGPIIAPSAKGVRYAHGLHYRRPTAMYVTRGLAGEFPVRYFCPPELTRIILFSGSEVHKT